jgi:hypothetical protein
MIVLLETSPLLPVIRRSGKGTVVSIKLHRVTTNPSTYIGKNIIGIVATEDKDTKELHLRIERRISARLGASN